MNREIKFRAWDFENKIMRVPNKEELGILIIDRYEGLQQYTGLHDKNGKEIYEGDILLNTTIKPQKIKIVKKEVIGAFGEAFCIEKINDYDNMTWRYDMDKIEVIGNVFESPDLLNK